MLLTTFRYQDEFLFFKEVIIGIRKTNENMLFELVNSLPNEKKDYMKFAVNCQRIINDEGKTQTRKIVRLKPKKILFNDGSEN